MTKELSETNTLVIGASAAGLATAACLKRASIDFLLIEREAQVGCAWRNHYERLHLHTPASHSGLPYLPMPASYPQYPAREQVVAYLDSYREHHKLAPLFGQEVISLGRREDGMWEAETQDKRILAQHVVVATGYTHTPHRPEWEGLSTYEGDLLHSSAYKRGAPWEGKQVLVVGFGNSGGEIAIDLHEYGAHPSMAVRSPVNIVPRAILGWPILSIGILMQRLPAKLSDLLVKPLLMLMFGDITKYGLRKLPYGPNTQIQETGRIPLLDIGTMRLIKQGKIKVHPGIERFTPGGVVFVDGVEKSFDALVLATGYRPALSKFLSDVTDVVDAAGVPVKSGEESALPGLFFCGFYVSPAGMLREIGIEAQRIADAIAVS